MLFKVDHLGFSTCGRFNPIAGTLDFDPAAPIASVDTPSNKLRAALRSESWLNAARGSRAPDSIAARLSSEALMQDG